MKASKWAVVLASVLVVGSSAVVAVRAADDAAPAKRAKGGERLIKPYSLLRDLTDDQKTKIVEIHKEEVAAEAKLRAQEKADIEAVLTEDQKKELTTLEEKTRAERKAERDTEKAKAEKDKADSIEPTTQPAKG